MVMEATKAEIEELSTLSHEYSSPDDPPLLLPSRFTTGL